MKIQCDVCNKSEASVFCTADEAALCDTCDHRVHHANKLASKHQRFSLLHPSSKQFPLCDICQEKRAFLFCQQDRAILCRECDYPIHAANEHTQKHNRYLLTGVKLSATSTLYGSSSNGAVSEPKATITTHSHSSVRNSVTSVTPPIPNPPKNSTSSTTTTNEDVTGLTSSISEYLIETLPGWHVEDLLDSSSPAFGFSKNDVGVLSPFWDCDIGNNQLSSFSSENTGIWVPQAPPPLYPSEMGKLVGLKETKEAANLKANVTRSWSDDAFTVPQINFPSTGSKRSRPFW